MGGDAYEVIAWARPGRTSPLPPHPLDPLPLSGVRCLLKLSSFSFCQAAAGLLCPRCPLVPQRCAPLVRLRFYSVSVLPPSGFPSLCSSAFLAPLSCPEPCTSFYPLSACVLWPFLGPRPISHPGPGLPRQLLGHCCQAGAEKEVHFIMVTLLSQTPSGLSCETDSC